MRFASPHHHHTLFFASVGPYRYTRAVTGICFRGLCSVPQYGQMPLKWAGTLEDRPAAVALLLGAGAHVNHADEVGGMEGSMQALHALVAIMYLPVHVIGVCHAW